jgi:LytR cell envelope-related transcriptional attenuator
MTDQYDPGSGRRRLRRAPRRGDSRATVTTVVVLMAAAAAVIAGFVILRSITDQTAGSVGDVATTLEVVSETTTSLAPITTPTTTPTTTTTTTAPRVSKSAATVVVANASGIGGSATAMTAELTAAGYTTAPVANSTGPQLEQSVIYFVEGNPTALGVARLLAAQIPSAQTLPMPVPPPLDRPLGAATVALLLGRDAAGRPLADL